MAEPLGESEMKAVSMPSMSSQEHRAGYRHRVNIQLLAPLSPEDRNVYAFRTALVRMDWYIAYTVVQQTNMKGLGKIFVQRIDGSGDRSVADPEGGAMLAGWSRDGKYLLFASDNVGTYQLWAVRVQDGRPEAIRSVSQRVACRIELTATTDGSIILRIDGSARYYIAQVNPATGAASTPRD